MSTIRSVIFDCYSTLVDIQTNEWKEELFHYLSLYLQYYGVKINPDDLRQSLESEKERYVKSSTESYPEIDLENVFGNTLKKAGRQDTFLAESCTRLFRALSLEHLQLYNDSLPVLRKLKKRGYILAIVTDAQKSFTPEECRILKIDHFFDHIVLSTQYGFKKPDPRLFMIACSLLRITPSEAVYIGDNPEKDIAGAKQVGMQTILLCRNSSDPRPETEPDYYAKDLWEAWKWIKKRE